MSARRISFITDTILTAIKSDPNQGTRTNQESAHATGMTSKGREIKVLLKEIKPNALVFAVRFWVDDISQNEIARTAVLTSIHESFAREGIKYPKPEEIKGID